MPINYLKRIQLEEFDDLGFKISPSLENETIIEGYYVFHKDAKENSHLIFNDGYPVLVFLQEQNDSVIVKENDISSEIKSAWASAGPVKNVYVKYNNSQQLLIVRFFPGAFYRLFDLDHQYFKKFPVARFDSIAGSNFFGLEDFFALPSPEEKINYIERFVMANRKAFEMPKKINSLLTYILKTKGNSSIKNLATSAEVNYKWLERNFLHYTGLLPKDFMKLQRFINAYIALVESNNFDLMDIAISNGYYDANHFLKDFRVFTGKSPIKYLQHSNRL